MKQYQIISETKNSDGSVESETVQTSTRKRDIESFFNGLMKQFKKEAKYFVEIKAIGWAVVTFYGEWGQTETEYYICKR